MIQAVQLAHLDDASLIAATAARLVPSEIESSFLIHAPLELLARAGLLPLVSERHRAAARARIAAIGARYQREARASPRPPPARFSGTDEAMASLSDSLETSRPLATDAAVLWLSERHDVKALRRMLWPLVMNRVGLAAHAPILFAELPRFADRLDGLASLLRAPMFTLSTEPGVVMATLPEGPALAADELERRLQQAPRVDVASGFIAPRLQAVQPLVPQLLSGLEALSPEVVRAALLRVAAQSMLEDDPAAAPYGWTHCLTLPLAVLENTDLMVEPLPALIVAATHVLAFRATSGRRALSTKWQASAAFAERFAPDSTTRRASLEALVVRAALHEDAHLVKYTRACLDAAAHSPADELLFFAAAERLGAWWDEHANAAG